MEKLDIFRYGDIRELLCAVYEHRKNRSQLYSLRAWSRVLGLKNPGLLSDVLRGKRRVNPDLGGKLAQNLQLKGKEKKYFDLLIMQAGSRGVEEKEILLDVMKKIHPLKSMTNLSVDRFRLISDWYNLAILEMFDLSEFEGTSEFVAKRLRGSLTVPTVMCALERLSRLGLIVQRNGKLERTHGPLQIGDGNANDAIKAHHLQVIELAKHALQNDAPNEREFSTTMLSIKSADVPRIKKLIEEFHKNIHQFVSKEGNEVFALGTQFFKLTESL